MKIVYFFVDLNDYANILVKKCSGGTKRKLNIAIAFIGKPQVIMFNQPTIAIDPQSQRKIWKIINYFKKKNKSYILLSSHNYCEIEQLCERY